MVKKELEELFEMNKERKPYMPPLDYEVSCYECDWRGILADCGIAYEQETWETPVYHINTCPECGEVIDI